MGKLPKQTKRKDLIKRFRDLGWTGPHISAKGHGAGDHPQYMSKDEGERIVKMPNPHRGDIGEVLLKMILAEAGLTAEKWLGLPEKKTGDDDQAVETPTAPDA
jgi:hypothetical protein